MELNSVRPTIETSGELEEKFFSIEDQGMIFDILRNKMYSNPILAICREITCNARDAHREVGTPQVPIHVHIPSSLEPFYKVKDFGPGISPDRMVNIFIKYTASTKRKDNIQTGGFGLGAKTPFSYSDTFSIITNYNGIQYNYACFIDETKVGKLALLSESPTKEPNGTEIIIPVKAIDYKQFTDWTEHTTRHWDVKPIIKGGTINFTEISKTIEGPNWAIVSPTSWHKETKLIVDGIEYPIDLTALKTYADTRLISSVRGNIHLYFNVGELSLSASREQVYLDKQTQDKICSRLDEMLNSLKQRVQDKISNFDNFWDANVYFKKDLNEVFNDYSIVGNLSWAGFKLFGSRVNLGCDVFSFSKGKYSRKYGTDPNKICRSNQNQHLSFTEDSLLFVNDLTLKEPTPRHVKKAFDDNPNIKYVYVIIPNSKITEDLLNKNYHIDLMKPKHLSEITKSSARNYTAPTSRLIIYQYHSTESAFRQVSYSVLEEDSKEKVLCTITKDLAYKRILLNNGASLVPESISILKKIFPDISFYGIDSSLPKDRIEEEFKNVQTLEDFVTKKVIENKLIDFTRLKYALQHCYGLDERNLQDIDYYRKLISNQNSIFLKRLNLHLKIKELSNNGDGLLSIYEAVKGKILDNDINLFTKNNPGFDISKINKEYVEKYPLMEFVSMSYYKSKNKFIEPVAQYINLIDNT